jgi:hypothetical protein
VDHGARPVMLALEGDLVPLAEAIAASLGGGAGSEGALRAALARAFPGLPEPDGLEPCSTHPALIVRMRTPGLGGESAKLVLVPRGDRLEVRLRAEIAGGSYRKETLLRVLAHLEQIEKILGD